ncbi:ribokinase [Actinophytocola sp.]|uniref:ribokinase n=1 Tax=Actinophytocola sp. TaxID=1872138 RepID=UPI002D35B439|nr:ribokinase [Actinophytocola sp.]HYQ69737.1 ribokinase [Actinophytocola sp.]
MSIVVVGSCNVDFIVPVAGLPAPGETVLGRDHLRAPGGKGANQAVAAARLGSPVTFVGCVGDDELAATIRGALVESGVDLTWLHEVPDTPSGIALITVADGGENTIAVSPGANARLGPAQLDAGLLSSAAVLLAQLEVPLDAVSAAVEAAGGTVLLNPAPARSLPAELLARVDVLIPNRSELGVLADAPEPTTIDEAAAMAKSLTGPSAVVVTLGADGALVVADEVEHVPAVPVDAVDATGAGDAFCGALADALARGSSLLAATRWAVRVAAVSTTQRGAQTGMPRREDVTS